MTRRKPTKTNANGLRIPRVARVLVDPIRHAIEGAAKPSAANIKQIVQALALAGTAMREGVATAGDWGVVAGAVDMAIAIERGGVVRGLMGHFEVSMPPAARRIITTDAWRYGWFVAIAVPSVPIIFRLNGAAHNINKTMPPVGRLSWTSAAEFNTDRLSVLVHTKAKLI